MTGVNKTSRLAGLYVAAANGMVTSSDVLKEPSGPAETTTKP